MIRRESEKELKTLAAQFKAVAVTGPRQSGKSTLVRYLFNEKPYVSLENLDDRTFALNDPRGFLETYKEGAIFDEIQKVPQLFSYLQQILDEETEPGKFILTDSNNFLLQDNISQSLAGRIAYLFLLPFSVHELKDYINDEPDELMFKGSYPPLYDQPTDSVRWLDNYVNTYVEKDVRQLINIRNQTVFHRFLKLCAGRVGQILNINNLAIETGVDNKTIASWISILESSFIIYQVKPHYKNFKKRITKTPKLYFYDTGLAAHLLGIKDLSQINTHPLYGSLFENFVISEFIKIKNHYAEPIELYYWRDNSGHEIDLLIDGYSSLYPVEIKAGKTITQEFFKNLNFFQNIGNIQNSAIIYQGNKKQQRSNGITVIPWKQLWDVMTFIRS